MATDLAPGVTYRYRAARPDGTIEQGTITATSTEAVSAMLATRGAWLLELRSETGEGGGARLSTSELALGLRLLGTFLESGLPLARALVALDDVAPPRWQMILPSVRDAVRDGQSLGDALARSPAKIPPVVIGIVRAGETGSGLAAAVRRAAALLEQSAATRNALRAALAYPAILAVAGLSAVALLVGVVLPKFAAILSDMGQTLPASTRAILWCADMLRTFALPGFVVLAGAIVAFRAWLGTAVGRRQWHAILLRVPVVGTVRWAAGSGRFAATLSALAETGVPIAVGLRSAAAACGDASLEQRVLAARDRVVHGEPIYQALQEEQAATATVIRMTRAGEESGRLAELLQHAGTIESERAERTVRSGVRILEPALILVFGGLVAFVAAALLQAVYSIRPGGIV